VASAVLRRAWFIAPRGSFGSSRRGAGARPRPCGALAAGAAGPERRLGLRLRQVRRSLRRRASTSSGRAPALDGTHPDPDAARHARMNLRAQRAASSRLTRQQDASMRAERLLLATDGQLLARQEAERRGEEASRGVAAIAGPNGAVMVSCHAGPAAPTASAFRRRTPMLRRPGRDADRQSSKQLAAITASPARTRPCPPSPPCACRDLWSPRHSRARTRSPSETPSDRRTSHGPGVGRDRRSSRPPTILA
jgi:hypothetical protein